MVDKEDIKHKDRKLKAICFMEMESRMVVWCLTARGFLVKISAGAFQCGIYMFPPAMRGFFPGTPASCMLGYLVTPN